MINVITFTSNKDKFSRAFDKAVDVGMEAVGQAAEANAVREVTKLVYDTPSHGYVRTGRLRNSITHKYVGDEKAVYVGTNVEYAPYVELGTRKMHERPFLRNAAQNYSDEYKSILEDALKDG